MGRRAVAIEPLTNQGGAVRSVRDIGNEVGVMHRGRVRKWWLISSVAALVVGATATVAIAATISFSPSSIDTTGKVSPAFGAATYVVTNDYDAFGVHFSDGGVDTAIFSDPPLAWGGVNGGGVVDLIEPVQGKIVVPGTGGSAGQTTSLSVEGGFAAVGSLLLEIFDCDGNLIGSTVNDDGTGPNGRTLMTLAMPGIASFHVSTPGSDTFGVDSIVLEDPTPCVLEVGIDIKPGSDVNPVKLSNNGVIPVAILSTATFDATTVDPATVCFGDAEDASQRDCTEAHGTGHIEDVNGDLLPDLVLHYETSETGIDFGDTEACLTGQTFGGQSVAGCDSVRTL